jgi:hypothetical protein
VRSLVVVVVLTACGRLDFGTQTQLSLVADPAVVDQTGSTLTFPVNVAAHDLLIMAVDHDDNIAVTSIQDAAGNRYSSTGARATATDRTGFVYAVELWYASDTIALDGNVEIALASSGHAFVWAEFAGIAISAPLATTTALDGQQPVGGIAASAPITTTEPDELVFVLNANDGGISAIADGNPFVALPPYTGDDSAYAILPEPGTYAAEWTIYDNSITSYCTTAAAFYAAP